MRTRWRETLQRQQAVPAGQALRRLRPSDDLAKEMGEDLGRREILLRRVPQEARSAEVCRLPLRAFFVPRSRYA